MTDYTRDELMALTPDRYLANGYIDESGHPRPELAGDFAIAAATQLRAAELPAQELAFTYEAWRLALEGQEGPPAERAAGAREGALETVAQMIQQPNNEGLTTWLGACVASVRQAEDIEALRDHLQAVTRLYSVIASLPEPSPGAASPEPSPP